MQLGVAAAGGVGFARRSLLLDQRRCLLARRVSVTCYAYRTATAVPDTRFLSKVRTRAAGAICAALIASAGLAWCWLSCWDA
jgi:hypothetical protein